MIHKDRLLIADPQGFDDIPTAAFDDRYTGTREEVDALWQVVQHIYLEASECQIYNQDENAWAQDVARRVLSWCPTKSNHQLLQLKSLQTQSINCNYLPISAAHIPVSKKADYALVYSRRDPAVRSICDHFDRAGLTLSQMTDTHTKRLMMAVGTEIKPAGGNSQEALAQLAIWSAAGLRSYVSCRNRRWLGGWGRNHSQQPMGTLEKKRRLQKCLLLGRRKWTSIRTCNGSRHHSTIQRRRKSHCNLYRL